MRLRLAAAALLAAATLACSEPPYSEMHRAQGALDAARAVGAETFAPAEYRDARQALDQSQQSVTQGDYRLALRYALDARERAQEAARAAADHKAEARSIAERAVGDTERAVADADARLQAARVARIRAKDLAPARQAADITKDALQKARAAMKKEGYLEVPGIVGPARAQLTEALNVLAKKEPPRPARRRH